MVLMIQGSLMPVLFIVLNCKIKFLFFLIQQDDRCTPDRQQVLHFLDDELQTILQALVSSCELSSHWIYSCLQSLSLLHSRGYYGFRLLVSHRKSAFPQTEGLCFSGMLAILKKLQVEDMRFKPHGTCKQRVAVLLFESCG